MFVLHVCATCSPGGINQQPPLEYEYGIRIVLSLLLLLLLLLFMLFCD